VGFFVSKHVGAGLVPLGHPNDQVSYVYRHNFPDVTVLGEDLRSVCLLYQVLISPLLHPNVSHWR